MRVEQGYHSPLCVLGSMFLDHVQLLNEASSFLAFQLSPAQQYHEASRMALDMYDLQCNQSNLACVSDGGVRTG